MTEVETEAPAIPKPGRACKPSRRPRRGRHAARPLLRGALPGLSFSQSSASIRKGECAGERQARPAQGSAAEGPGDPHPAAQDRAAEAARRRTSDQKDRAFIKSITLYEDDDVLVLNKPMGLAVQGGSGTYRHLDGMLGSMTGKERPAAAARASARQGHLGCLLVAKTASPPPRLRKPSAPVRPGKYTGRWSPGVPRPKQGRVSTFLAKEDARTKA